MVFLFDSDTHEFHFFNKQGAACRYAIQCLGGHVNEDPVQTLKALDINQRFARLNLEDAFMSIAESDDGGAQHTAKQMAQAVAAYYARGK